MKILILISLAALSIWLFRIANRPKRLHQQRINELLMRVSTNKMRNKNKSQV